MLGVREAIELIDLGGLIRWKIGCCMTARLVSDGEVFSEDFGDSKVQGAHAQVRLVDPSRR